MDRSQPPVVIEASDGHADSVVFSADGGTLVTGGMDNRIRLWEVGS